MAQERSYTVEKNLYKVLRITSGVATLLGGLITISSLCSIGLNSIESPSVPGPFTSEDVPGFLLVSGGGAVFTVASAGIWNYSSNRYERLAKKH